ncbi:hypothetical protein PM082_024640 [Marasmius tenuissimus]|nr:hypothetical protein PM082_024640 [Marasmius tenuissimus]
MGDSTLSGASDGFSTPGRSQPHQSSAISAVSRDVCTGKKRGRPKGPKKREETLEGERLARLRDEHPSTFCNLSGARKDTIPTENSRKIIGVRDRDK